MASDNPTKPDETPAQPEPMREERLELARKIKAAVREASPLGQIERHEKTVCQMIEDGFDPDEANYRRFVEDARLFYSRGDIGEARVYLARAVGAFVLLERIYDPDRITGAKQRKNLSGLRDTQNKNTMTRAEERRKIVRGLIGRTRLTKGALDRWIVEQLEKDHGIIVSERTVRADRASLRLRQSVKPGALC